MSDQPADTAADSTNGQFDSDELKALKEQVALAENRLKLITAQKGITDLLEAQRRAASGQQQTLDAMTKQNEILAAQLTTLQTQKSLLTAGLPETAVTTPRKGDVTTDDNTRFLSNLVVQQGLSKVAETIATTLAANGTGGILVVDDTLDPASDVNYLDIRNKLTIMTNHTQKIIDECASMSKRTTPRPVEEVAPWEEGADDRALLEEEEGETDEGWAGLALLPSLPFSTPATVAIGAISAGLGAIGDIVGFFRSDYAVKGQPLTNLDNTYIQSIVADRLREKNRDVYLLDFLMIEQSPLLTTLNELLEKQITMLTNVEEIKSRHVTAHDTNVTALHTHLAGLRVKQIDYLVKASDQVIQDLRTEIGEVLTRLRQYYAQTYPASAISSLETHLADLRKKLVDEVVTNHENAKGQLQEAINIIVKKLKDHEQASGDKKLTQAEVKALEDQLKVLHTKLADVLAGIGHNAEESLNTYITTVKDELETARKNHVPASQITGEETHLADLRAKLTSSLLARDDAASDALEQAIKQTEKDIQTIQETLLKAQGIINSSVRINDAVNTFVTAITTASGGTRSPLATACIREHFADGKIEYLLRLKLISAGADYIVESTPFWRWQPNTFYFGGGVVSYLMADRSGKIVASGTVTDGAAIHHQIGWRTPPHTLDWQIHD